jgi:hypothetical protein
MGKGAKKGSGKSGRITLRVKPELHEQLAELGQALGLDINGLLNLMIRRSLPKCVAEARMVQAWEAEQMEQAFKAWRGENPDRPTREFWEDYLRRHGDVVHPSGDGGDSRQEEQT